MPDRAEVVSQKYSNMRYKDKSSAKQKMDTFLEDAYMKQIRESNGTTAVLRNLRARKSKNNSKLIPISPSELARNHYVRQIYSNINRNIICQTF